MQVNAFYKPLIEIPLPLSSRAAEGLISPSIDRRARGSLKEGWSKPEIPVRADLHKTVAERVKGLLEMAVIVERPACRITVGEGQAWVAVQTAQGGKRVPRITIGIVARQFNT